MSTKVTQRAVTRALIGEGGVKVGIFVFYPTDSFRKKTKKKERAERENMNTQPSIKAIVRALCSNSLLVLQYGLVLI